MSSEHELCQIWNTFVYIEQLLYLNKLPIFFVIRFTVKSHIQYYAKSEDNFNMVNNFKWTTPGISNLTIIKKWEDVSRFFFFFWLIVVLLGFLSITGLVAYF
jgi:hypothetical protein